MNDYYCKHERECCKYERAWADDHGYYHWKCRECGMSGWIDTHPECNCSRPDEEEETEDEEFS